MLLILFMYYKWRTFIHFCGIHTYEEEILHTRNNFGNHPYVKIDINKKCKHCGKYKSKPRESTYHYL